MIRDDIPLAKTVVLVDTNAIIEAVRTRTWNGLTGGMLIETVEECRDEAGRGDSTKPSYVVVSAADLGRMHRVHAVTPTHRADYLLTDTDAAGMDPGEQDLFAHALQRVKSGDVVWVLCSPDKASIRAAVRLHWADQLRSLEALAAAVGARPKAPFKPHFQELFLSKYRTEYLLSG